MDRVSPTHAAGRGLPRFQVATAYPASVLGEEEEKVVMVHTWGAPLLPCLASAMQSCMRAH